MAAGQQAAGGLVNTALGLMLEKHNDERQLRQQNKLSQLQIGFDKEMTDYQQKKQLEMWEATNYAAQKAQMKAAGLSPGLMYGMGGAGGATVGGGAAHTGGGQAPAGGGEIMGLQLMGAQKKLIEAQTKKTEAETTKTAGPDTELATANARIAKYEGQMKHDTYEEVFSAIRADAQKSEEEWRKAAAEGKIAEETAQTRIDAAKADLAGIGIANELRKSQKELTDAEITETINRIAQKWEEIEVQKGRLQLEKWVRDVSDSTKLAVETVAKVAGAVLSKGGKVEAPKSERGWSERYGEWWKTKE